jgi:methanethiol S-methyltransferase
MALTTAERQSHVRRDTDRTPIEKAGGRSLAWSGFVIMWMFWISFVIFLADPVQVARFWPLPTVDDGGFVGHPVAAAAINIALIALFGVQHSLMARPWFKERWTSSLPPAFERCAFVHMANLALFALIIFWQPIPIEIWTLHGWARDAAWVLFAMGWVILFAGAWSFGMFDLLGIDQMRAWCRGENHRGHRLKTGWLYKWLRHPMYVGVLLGVWATPKMSAGHLLLAGGMTLYVLIAMRYEERDLMRRFGTSYARWRASQV